MKSRSVFIELRSFRLDIAVFDGGRCIDARRMEFDLSNESGEWAQSLCAASGALEALVNELDIRGLPTTVLYRSPTHATELSSLEIKSSSNAAAAASLSCLDALSYSTLAAVHDAHVLGRDASGPQPRTHAIAAADRDDIVASISQFVEDAGLQFECATPIDAAVLSSLVSTALQHREGLWARLYIGETTSFFLVVRDGRLLFARRIRLGLETLARALTRPTRTSTGSETVELDLATARTILHHHGLPDRETVVDRVHHLTGAEVGPLLQPVFQRFIVELRQSMRFILNEEDRRAIDLVISGPGASVPRINELFSEELNVASEIDALSREYKFDSPCSSGSELQYCVSHRRAFRRLGLQSRRVANRRRASALRRWLVTGTAAALMVIAFDAGRYHLALKDARSQAAAVSGRAADLKSLQETAQLLQDALEQWRVLDATIRENTAVGFDFHAIFKELSRRTPDNVKLTAIRFQHRDDQRVASMAGYVMQDEMNGNKKNPPPDADALQRFIENLRSSPLFIDVALGAVQKTGIGDRTGRRFDVELTCAAIARDLESARLAGTTEDHEHAADHP